jgi:trk system potassium uptake protein
MLIIIIGCGRMGSMVANQLSRKGESVIVVDANEKTFEALTTDFSGFRVIGDATQVEILKQAKLKQADLLLVLTGNDNVNMTVAQLGQHFFEVGHVIARVLHPERESIFEQLGIDTINPIKLAVSTLVKDIETIEQKQLSKEGK